MDTIVWNTGPGSLKLYVFTLKNIYHGLWPDVARRERLTGSGRRPEKLALCVTKEYLWQQCENCSISYPCSEVGGGGPSGQGLQEH